MESANLNLPSDRDAELDALLRRADSPLADDGFSARVVAALPSRTRRNRTRFWLCAAAAAAGIVVARTHGASAAALSEAANEFQRSFANVAGLMADPSVTLALVITAVALVYVFWRDPRSSP